MKLSRIVAGAALFMAGYLVKQHEVKRNTIDAARECDVEYEAKTEDEDTEE